MEDEKILDEAEPKVIRSLAECKIASQHLQLQLEQREKDYSKIEKQKQEYFYENVAWMIILVIAVVVLDILQAIRPHLYTSAALGPIVLILEVGVILIAVHVIYLARHFWGMEHPKSGKFVRYQDILSEYKMYVDNVRALSEKADMELEIKVAEEEELNREMEAESKAAFVEEQRLLSRWDNKDEIDIDTSAAEETKDLSDTARIILEALKDDK